MIVALALLHPFLITTCANALSMSVNAGGSFGVVSKTTEWEMHKIAPNVRVQGETRHTFSFSDPTRNTIQVALDSPSGRPVDSELNLWLGPDYTPYSLKCHSEDGNEYPIQALVGTKGYSVNLEVKNIGSPSYPLTAACSYAIDPLSNAPVGILSEESVYVEGGAIKNISYGAEVDQLQVLMKTGGKHLKARIELLRGPNNIKQAFEVYSSNGEKNYLFLVFDMPGDTNAVRFRNLATLEYPMEFYARATKTSEAPSAAMKWN